jgi:hypothetical protein
MDSAALASPANVSPAPITVAQLRDAQKFNLAVGAGIGAALLGAILWAVVTVVTKMELGLVAVAVGYLVGRAVRAAGHGIDPKFGYLGAVCALLGCVLGNILGDIGFYADAMKLGYGDALARMDLALLERLIAAFFKPMDVLFYGIAIYEGYKFSFKYKVLKPPPATPAN